MRTFIFFIVCFGLNTPRLFSCSCLPINTFCEAQYAYLAWGGNQTLVVRARLTDKVNISEYQTDLTFNIQESFFNPRKLTEVKISGGNGADCARGNTEYNIGDELIFVVIVDSTFSTQFGICIPPPLIVRGNQVLGQITGSEEKMSLNQFRKLSNCTQNTGVVVFPNPAQNVVRIVFRFAKNLEADLRLFDVSGKLVFEHLNQLIDGSMEIDVSNLSSGNYYLQVSSLEVTHNLPIVVARGFP